jgi:uncharacterized iron-regulated protein
MRLLLRRSFVHGLVVLATIVGCAGIRWQSEFNRDHPLVGRIWDVRDARFIDERALDQRLSRAKFVMLGEKHDNPDHHQLQARILRAMVAAGRRPAVAFEMFTTADASAIERHLAAAPRDAAGLGDAVNWKKSGWPDWELYQPIADVALQARLRIVAANLPPATAREVARHGAGALDQALVARYALDRPAAADIDTAMAAEIRSGHCNQAPENLLPRMVLAQRARDAQMADSLLAVAEPDGAALITGNGHARVDQGVPLHLRAQHPDAAIASVGILEVQPDLTTPPAYVREFDRDRLPFDYVWFTPRVDDSDPCEKFGKSLEQLRQRR